MPIVRFDDSLQALSDVIAAHLGEDALATGTVLRDAIGQLAFFANAPLGLDTTERVSLALREKLGAYARSDRVLAGAEDYGADAVLQDRSAVQVSAGNRTLRVVDRRLVGADWLRYPAPPAPPPPRIVFASLKGGVGRSTALAVVASHLATKGRRVLAIDLDMEAPGLGAMLLDDDTLPEFGLIDALVENKLSGLDSSLMADLTGPSPLAAGRGRIDVLPALGKRSVQHPANVLAKIARVYVEKVCPDGAVETILDQVRSIVNALSEPSRHDVILIDARAGLHETTASAVLGLGAEVLLFGLNEPQTFQGYSVLLAHMACFLPQEGKTAGWLERLTVVQGKAPADKDARDEFAQSWRNIVERAGLGPPTATSRSETTSQESTFGDVSWNDELPDEEVLPADWPLPDPIAVLDDARFQRFDPLKRRDVLSEAVFRTAFGQLLDVVDHIIVPTETGP